MKKIFWIISTITFFSILVLAFGLPRKMNLIERDSAINDKCMLGDNLVTDLLNELNQIQPQLILVGNSMLGEAVDQNEMTKLTGLQTVKVWLGGSGSAWWYLVIKNIFPDLAVKPKYVGIVFRDNYLTLPQHKVNGKHRWGIDAFAGSNEEVLNELAYYSSMSYPGLFMHKYFPLFNRREKYKESFEYQIKEAAAFLTGGESVSQVNEFIAEALDNEKMDSDMLHKRQLADELAQDEYKKDMNFRPEKSFLKYIIELCKEQGVALFFIRVKRLRDASDSKESPELLRYIAQLKRYLSERNIPLIDYTYDTSITKQHFGKGDHLNRGAGRKIFTASLSKRINGNIALLDRQLNLIAPVNRTASLSTSKYTDRTP